MVAFEVVQLAVLFAFPDLHPSVPASTPVAGFPLPVFLSISPSLSLSVCFLLGWQKKMQVLRLADKVPKPTKAATMMTCLLVIVVVIVVVLVCTAVIT